MHTHTAYVFVNMYIFVRTYLWAVIWWWRMEYDGIYWWCNAQTNEQSLFEKNWV